MKLLFGSSTLLAFVTLGGISRASTITQNVNITARYNATCELTVPGVFDFGNIISNSADLYATARVVVSCDAGINYGLSADNGTHALSTQRRMKNISVGYPVYLNYDIYVGSTGSTAISTSQTNSGYTGAGNSEYPAIRGHMASGQALIVGVYTDTVIFTLSY